MFIFALRRRQGFGDIKMERVNGMNYRLNCKAIKGEGEKRRAPAQTGLFIAGNHLLMFGSMSSHGCGKLKPY